MSGPNLFNRLPVIHDRSPFGIVNVSVSVQAIIPVIS